MSKKFNLVLFAVMIASFAMAAGVKLPKDSLGIHPWDGKENDKHWVRQSQSHWSMYLGAGFNVFDGDYINDQKHSVWFPSASLGAAYHWNNTWSIGAEYTFRQYRVTGGKRECDADILLQGLSHQAGAYVGFDIFNAFRPQNKRKIFALDVLVGGGAVWKKNSIFYDNVYYDKITSDTWWKDGTTAEQKAKGETRKDDKYNVYGVFTVGLGAEFNVNRSIQLGLRGVYNYTTSDYIDGRKRSNNNDGWFDTEFIIRYKFDARKKSHVRNMMAGAPEKWNDGTYYKSRKMGEAKRAAKCGPDRGASAPADTVFVVPTVTSRVDTLYIITRDTVWVMSQAAAGAAQPVVEATKKYVVYFENDIPELDKVAIATTCEAAAALNQDSTTYAVVIGSCDNTGTMVYNQWLAVQRANNVATSLSEMGVDINRVYTVGRGIMQDDRAQGSYSANRRVEINIVSAEEWAKAKEEYAYFEQFKQVKKGSALRQESDKYASSSEVLKTAIQNMKETGVAMSINEIVNTIVAPSQDSIPAKDTVVAVIETEPNAIESAKSDVLDTVVVTPAMTLSQLARKYYNNTNMWVKIFEANRDVIESPDHLEDGMQLIIPRI